MARATWKGKVIAESDDTILLEGKHYFPPDSINWEYLESSAQMTVCPSKGGSKLLLRKGKRFQEFERGLELPKSIKRSAYDQGLCSFLARGRCGVSGSGELSLARPRHLGLVKIPLRIEIFPGPIERTQAGHGL